MAEAMRVAACGTASQGEQSADRACNANGFGYILSLYWREFCAGNGTADHHREYFSRGGEQHFVPVGLRNGFGVLHSWSVSWLEKVGSSDDGT
jgi:hypothetical protein